MNTFQTYWLTPLIGKGKSSRVHAISNNHAVKVIKNKPGVRLINLQNEYKIASELYNEGISIPKPEGIFPVEIRYHKNAFGLCDFKKEGFIMERIHGINGMKVHEDLIDWVYDLHREQIEKCLKLGFGPFDDGRHNSIYVPKEKKLYLIDFHRWVRD